MGSLSHRPNFHSETPTVRYLAGTDQMTNNLVRNAESLAANGLDVVLGVVCNVPQSFLCGRVFG